MRRFYKLIVFALLFGAFQTQVCSQTVSVISGKVTDNEGNPLPGASITIEGTLLGVQSASDGTFAFKDLTDGSYKLIVSFIGYESYTHELIHKGKSDINIILNQRSLVTDEVIISATRAGTRSPIAYSNIDSELLKKHNSGHDLPYLLSLTPSLVETSESGNGIGYTSLRIRGSEGNRINVTLDGIPLNDAESQQVFWVDLPDLASSVDNIQIQRGVGTSSNGAGAFGATINIQSKSPDNEPFATIGSSLGSFNTQKTVFSAGTGLLADKFAFQIRYSELKSDGYIDRTGSEHRSTHLSGVYRTEKSRLKVNVILGEEHTGIGWWGVPKDTLPVNRRYNPAGEYTDETGTIRYYNNESDNYNQNHYQLFYSYRMSKHLSFNSALHYTRGKGYYEEYKEDASLEGYGLNPITIGPTTIEESDLIRQKWLANDFYGYVYSMKYQKNRIDLAVGGGANYYSGDHFGNIIWMQYAGSSEKDHMWYFNNGKKGEISIYGKLNYSLTDNLNAFGDLQYRYIRYNMKGFDDDLKDLKQTHHFGFFNPKAGLFWAISSQQDAYLSFAVANREPTRADYKEAAGDINATPKPETLYDTELGYKIRTGKSVLGINLYGMIYKDQLVPTGELSNVGYPIMTNVEKSYRMGIEISAGIKPASFIDWSLNMTLSRNKISDFVEYYTDYNTTTWEEEYKSRQHGSVDIAYSPSFTGTSDLGFNLFRNSSLHFVSKYVGKQYFDNTMSSDRKLDPYLVNNIRLDFEPGISKIKRAEFQLLVNNIFNQKYVSNAYGGNWYEGGAEKTWAYYFPQAGINFMIRANFTF